MQVRERVARLARRSIHCKLSTFSCRSLFGLRVELVLCACRYKAVFKYRPRNADELELREGDVISVMEKCDDGWFVGTCLSTNHFGTFPGNYVRPLQ